MNKRLNKKLQQRSVLGLEINTDKGLEDLFMHLQYPLYPGQSRSEKSKPISGTPCARRG